MQCLSSVSIEYVYLLCRHLACVCQDGLGGPVQQATSMCVCQGLLSRLCSSISNSLAFLHVYSGSWCFAAMFCIV